ncbi:Response regulator transcription factor [Sulfidibacter corallicola]|uniref:Response regulator transcription factor n=2 Tax=Sulfidibacter corallicola TaxID=2818388 RepID=A0A8A4TGW9_SULCO|nr:response regulator transcription factor [Sulfidibacter corallicola]QTD47968.1 response regulator transcription factor [Sulfidibacter corallicola]
MSEAPKPYILIVEDDEKLAALIREYLEAMGFAVAIESRGDTAPARILAESPDLVILDIMLPGLDGVNVCRQIRPKYHGAILMLTSLDEEVDEVVGLEVGADDYMAKPVRPRLLVAHINALLRRGERGRETESRTNRDSLSVGKLVLNPQSREVRVDGQPLDLTTAEFELLALLMEKAGEIVSREFIYETLRGIEYDGLDRSIDLRVARLRKKIGDTGKSPTMIKSVRGVGYLLAAGHV